MGDSVVKRRADWIAVLEAIHAPASDDDAWANPVVEALQAAMPAASGIGVNVVEHDEDYRVARTIFDRAPASMPDVGTAVERLQTEHVGQTRVFYDTPSPVVIHSELTRGADPAIVEEMQRYSAALGIRDAVGVVAHPEPTIALVVWGTFEKAIALSSYERRLLARVALHLEAGYRLRRRPEIVLAEVSADGRVLERTEDAPSSATLAERVRRVSRARTKTHRTTAESLDLWPALLSGRTSLVERSHGSYAVIENPPSSQVHRALTKAEADVVAIASRGLSTKLTSYALGLSPSVVSDRLASAAAKLGVATREELVRLAALLGGAGPARTQPTTLTDAERDVLDLLRRGLSNREIAEARSRSVRTVANQVASLLRKTQSESRRALLVARI